MISSDYDYTGGVQIQYKLASVQYIILPVLAAVYKPTSKGADHHGLLALWPNCLAGACARLVQATHGAG